MSEELTQKLNEINDIKGQIKTSMINKGLAVTDETPFREYPTALDNMSSGGEKIFAHYVDTDVAEGKKVMMTKVTNPITIDSEFCNGFIPFIINNGFAYGVGTSSVSSSQQGGSTFYRQIVDGVISTQSTALTGSSLDWRTYYTPIRHSINGGTVGVASTHQGSSLKVSGTINMLAFFGATKGSTQYLGNTYNFKNKKRFFFLEHYVVACGPADYNDQTSFVAFSFSDSFTNTTLVPYSESAVNYFGCLFERAGEDGKSVYWLHSDNSSSFANPSFKKYNFETKTLETLTTPYWDIQEPLKDYLPKEGVYFQTKDYKYLIHQGGYIFLNYYNPATSPNRDGIVAKKFPQQILDAIGDRTIVNLQVFYDNYFALMLSDGATLMCHYNWDIIPAGKVNEAIALGGDYLAVCDVEEVEPFKLPDSDTIYQRAFSESRDFWYITMQGVSEIKTTMNPAGQFDKENITNSYFAFMPSSVRFNSTVLTGFMTGESKTENGKQLVEVSTVTG